MTDPPHSISVLLADDHIIVRKGVRALLEQKADIRVVGEAGDGREAIQKVGELTPDVLVIDISMPGLNGIKATRQITRAFPATRVIALSIHSTRQFIKDMFKAGAVGYLLKESAPEELVEGIYAVMRGELHLSKAIMGKVVTGFAASSGEKQDSAVEDYKNVDGLTTIPRGKFHRPQTTTQLVHRRHLIDRLNEGLHKSLILVSAPAGFGKTTLVSAWLDSYDGFFTWLSLDQDDDDPERFVHLLIAALEPALTDPSELIGELPTGGESLGVAPFVARVCHALETAGREPVLVIDDMHHLRHPVIHELLGQLSHHATGLLHLVLIGRRDPFLALSQMRAGNQIEEIRTSDLRFTMEETSAFLKNNLGQDIDGATIATWAQKTEGWITGLRLASLAFRHGRKDGMSLVLPENAQYVMEYLFNEVLSKQTEAMRGFLIHTAILNRFCAPLCTAVAAPEQDTNGKPIDGWEFIAFLNRESLFTVPLDSENRWHRYHSLFQRLLNNQLERYRSPAEIAGLHIRAADWFAENGLIGEGVHHALCAGDINRAAELVERHRHSALNSSRWFLLQEWLSMFSENALEQYPALLLARIWIDYYHARFDRIAKLVDAAEADIGEDARTEALQGELDLFRGIVAFMAGDGPRSLQSIEAASEAIPDRLMAARGLTDIYRGLALQMNGRCDQAVRELADRLLVPSLPYPHRIRLTIALEWIHLIAGDLTTALRYNRQLSDIARQYDDQTYRVWSSHIDGLISFHRNEPEAAAGHFGQAAASGDRIPPPCKIDALAGLALACQAAGQSEKSVSALERLERFARTLNDPAAEAIAETCRLRVRLAQGAPVQDVGAIGQASATGIKIMAVWIEVPEITLCRRRIAEGTERSLQKADKDLRRLLDLNRRHHNIYQSIDITVLLAVVNHRLGRKDEALSQMATAVALAEPGGWVRPFAEGGTAATDLLRRLRQKNPSAGYVARLLAMLEPEMSASAPEDHEIRQTAESSTVKQTLVEPLTNREMDVLELLAQRWRNKEIAERLYVSPTTVKSHLKSIYQKLYATNRREAVEIARKLGILVN